MGRTAYQSVLDQSFEKHFPQWDRVSPLDPTKVISDALSLAAEEIEKRQNRFVETVLGTLPSLFSIAPKPARLPRGIFAAFPTARLAESRSLDECVFRFQGEGPLKLVRPLGATLVPFAVPTVTRDANTVRVRVATRGAVGEIPLAFIPAKADGPPNERRLVEISVAVDGAAKPLFAEDLQIVDKTQNFTRFGYLRLKPVAHPYFAEKAATVELSLTFDLIPAGTFTFNAFEGEISETQNNFALGELAGDPWEAIKLSDRIVLPPEQIELRFPNDHYRTLTRLREDILRVREIDDNVFFYDATEHRLILPAAHRLGGRFLGGVAIVSPEQTLAPSSPWMDATYQGSPGEWVASIEKLTAIAPLDPGYARETSDEYLQRFYGLIRRFIAANQPSGRFDDTIADAVRSADPEVLHVESIYEESTKQISLSLLTRETTDWTALVGRLEPTLARTIPLECSYRLFPMAVRKLGLNLRLTLRRGESDLPPDRETLVDWLRQKLNALTDPRHFPTETPLTLDGILEKLAARLAAEFDPKPGAIAALDAQLFDAGLKSYVTELRRGKGEKIDFAVELHVDLIREGGRS